MPEAVVGSAHYRVLFLTALVLFMFTFVVNTFAELASCFILWCSMVLMLNIEVSPIVAIAGLILTGMALVSVRAFSAGVQRFWPRDFFALFYVGHLVLLGVLAEVAL